MSRTKMVRVSEEELELLRKARKELQRRGYARLEDQFSELAEDELEEDDLGDLLAGLALGAIVAAGALALLKLLTQEGSGSR